MFTRDHPYLSGRFAFLKFKEQARELEFITKVEKFGKDLMSYYLEFSQTTGNTGGKEGRGCPSISPCSPWFVLNSRKVAVFDE
jgi:hypothetical protein